MGNCQAVDAAAMVIQHPNGRIDRMYWTMSASEVMKMNPGYYVSLIIPLLSNDQQQQQQQQEEEIIRFTRVHLLRPTDTLLLGRAYRLIPSQEVKKVVRAKKQADEMKKKNKKLQESVESQREKSINESNNRPAASSNAAAAAAVRRLRSWRPSLQTISESTTTSSTPSS
ncbi:uncharacterized protein LOC124937086 [Impatiens glandulifera]|uniref:uncharacterized protein LOC124937086 n=1 Tax=Impatiens glandulifera TaxID=253017 RepID=UPI001FB17311|nr:uncharacterized protein LOC124937086 [Impatiens glandulifera]